MQLLDAFWESKGIITQESFKAFCSESVLLLRTSQFIYENNERFKGIIEFANYSPNTLNNASVEWVIEDQQGKVFKEGAIRNKTVQQGEYFIFGELNVDLSELQDATKLTLTAKIKDTDILNSWDLWVYPPNTKADISEVLVTADLDEAIAALNKGKRVVYTPSSRNIQKKVNGKFVPVFWSPVHFPKQAGTMGILCKPEHEALADFPTDFHSNWQWWGLTREMSAIDISSLNSEIIPIVQVIDNFARNAKLAGVMEVRVGKGLLLVSAFDITKNLEERPVARQLKRSLCSYATSSYFNPKVEISESDLRNLFLSHHPWQNSTILKSTPGQSGYEAKNVLDGDPNTMWHTQWGGKEIEMPHEIIIDASELISIKGIRIVQRGVGKANGRVKDFEVYISENGEFDQPQVVGHCMEGEPYHDVLFSQKYMDESRFKCRYIKLKIISSENGKPYTAISEIEIIE